LYKSLGRTIQCTLYTAHYTALTNWILTRLGKYRPVVTEWFKEARKELDFREEAINLERVRLATLLEPSLAHVVIPKSFPEYTTKRVRLSRLAPFATPPATPPFHSTAVALFTMRAVEHDKVLLMEFCEGCPIKDLEALDRKEVDRAALLATVTAAFAEQIFVDGCCEWAFPCDSL
jgi:predicted unusual protein kinase regulating ubiquinone biosynthesis (AarF/ABC1/UbiB family)